MKVVGAGFLVLGRFPRPRPPLLTPNAYWGLVGNVQI